MGHIFNLKKKKATETPYKIISQASALSVLGETSRWRVGGEFQDAGVSLLTPEHVDQP